MKVVGDFLIMVVVTAIYIFLVMGWARITRGAPGSRRIGYRFLGLIAVGVVAGWTAVFEGGFDDPPKYLKVQWTEAARNQLVPVASSQKPTWTPRLTPRPVVISRPTATPAHRVPFGCLEPGEAIQEGIGAIVCVYGIVVEGERTWYGDNQSTTETIYTLVGPNDDWLAIEDYWRIEERPTEGSCLAVTGRVSLLSGCANYRSSGCLFLRVTEGGLCK